MNEQTVQAEGAPAVAQAPVADPNATAQPSGVPNDPQAMLREMNAKQQAAAELATENAQLKQQMESLRPVADQFNDPSFREYVDAYYANKGRQTPRDVDPDYRQLSQNVNQTNARLNAIELNSQIDRLRGQVHDLPPAMETQIRAQIAKTGLNDPAYHYYAIQGQNAITAAAQQAAQDASMAAALEGAERNSRDMGASPSAEGPSGVTVVDPRLSEADQDVARLKIISDVLGA